MNGVAQVGNMSAIVTLDYDGRLWYFSQTISDTGWNKNPVSAEVKFNSAPSIAQVGDSAVIAVAGPDGALWFYQQAISTLPNGVWNLTPALSDPGSLSQVPSVAQVGDSAVIALVDNFGTLWSYQKKINTEIWSPPQQVVSSGSTAFALQSPSVAQVGDSAVIAAVDTSGGLRFYWQTIGTTPWNPELVDGPTTGSGRILAYPSVAQVGDSAVIIAVDNTSSLWSYWQTIGTKPWNPDSVLQTEPEAPFLTLPYPSVAQVGNSSVITASDNWGNLWYFWQTIGTAEWHQEPVASHESLGG